MSDRITIKYVGGDECEHLESCKTWDDLSGQMESVVEFVTLKHSRTPRVIFEGVDGMNYEATIEFRAIKQEYVEEDEDEEVMDALAKVLTKGLAEEFLKNPESVDLSEFGSIDDDAAIVLSAADELWLTGLRKIGSEVAASLAKQKGTLVIKIENSEMEVVESICKHQGTFLSLSGEATRSLSDKAFNNLSNHKGNIEFFDLDELSDFGAKMLSKHKGNLFFEALFELSKSAKESLSKYQGEINHLPAKEWVESL